VSRAQEFVRILAAPADRLEAAMHQVLNAFNLDTSEGFQLDLLGKFVGQSRFGMTDEDFRRFIRARIKANRSSGMINEILEVIGLVLDDAGATLTFKDEWPAAFALEITDTVISLALAEILVAFLRVVKAGGVRGLLQPALDVDGDLLYLDIDNLDQERFIPAME
jgi:hypothetical protein